MERVGGKTEGRHLHEGLQSCLQATETSEPYHMLEICSFPSLQVLFPTGRKPSVDVSFYSDDIIQGTRQSQMLRLELRCECLPALAEMRKIKM